jgi:Heat shock protein
MSACFVFSGVRLSTPAAALVFCACQSFTIAPASMGVEQATLEGSAWLLTRVNGQSIGKLAQTPRLALDKSSGLASGFAGCNDFSARYASKGANVTFSRVTYTRKRCVDPLGTKAEDAFLRLLPQVRSWRIRGATLSLRNASGKLLLEFTQARSG